MKFLITMLLFSSMALAQPLLYKDEIVLELSDIKCASCIKDSKVSINIMSGGIGALQTSVIFKLTGEKGKLGSQVFTKINPYIWVGGEATTDLKLNFEHEFYISSELNYKDITIFPYITYSIKEEHIMGGGAKLYVNKSFSIAVEYKKNGKESGQISVALGTKINTDALENLKKLFSLGEQEDKK